MTTDDDDPATAEALSDAAIEWVVFLKSGRAKPRDLRAFEAWRRKSAAHDKAARDAEAIWAGVASSRLRPTSYPAGPGRLATRRGLGLATAAGLGVLALGAYAYAPVLLADHATAIGERLAVDLPDGSTLVLNSGAAVDVEYGSDIRRIRLIDGEAVFEVARDPLRPFSVATEAGAVVATGTVFSVRQERAGARVVVVEGAVEVMPRQGAPVAAAMGQGVSFTERRATPAERVDVDTALAWRRGLLVFRDRPLGEVLAELDRHFAGRILVLSSEGRQLAVTGVFRLDDPARVLATLEQTLPITVTRLPGLALVR